MKININADLMAQMKQHADALPKIMAGRLTRADHRLLGGKTSVMLAVTEAELREIAGNLTSAGTSFDVVFGASVDEMLTWFDKEIQESANEVLSMILSVTTMEPHELSFLVGAAQKMATVLIREVLDDTVKPEAQDQNVMIAVLYVSRTMTLTTAIDADDVLRDVLRALKVL